MTEAKITFDDFFLDDALLFALEKLKFHTPTPIQHAAIPSILEGKDILAGAATGTGKTLAFVLPILQKLIDEPNNAPQARCLILAPTRELVFQIQYVIQAFSSAITAKTVTVTGGFSPGKQVELIQQDSDIIIATPGRLLSLVSAESFDLSDIEMVIIDEADRMLDMGQGPDVLSLLATIAHGFQACLFSATLAGTGVNTFANEILRDAEVIQLDAANSQAKTISQVVYLADDRQHKQALLLACINQQQCERALVFCNKKEQAEQLAQWLQSQNISAQVLHGDFNQAERRDKTRKFRQGKIKIMVATDLAARGLDLPSVSHVINYDLPYRGDIYIHRIGRTGRAGQQGIAINLVEHHDLKQLERIEYHLKTKLAVVKMAGLEPQSKHRLKHKNKSTKKPRYIAKKDRNEQV